MINKKLCLGTTDNGIIVWKECQQMVRHYCETFIKDPVGTAVKNTFLLNSRVAAKILASTPLYVTEEDLGNNTELSPEARKQLEDLNQRWIEINLGRTIAFKVEMSKAEAQNYRRKVDELEKLFDGYIVTGEIGNHMEENEPQNIAPVEAERMKTALTLIRNEFGVGLAYNKQTGQIKVGGLQLSPTVLLNINKEVEATVLKTSVANIMSGNWRKDTISDMNKTIGHTLDLDYRNLVVIWDMIKPLKIKLKRKIINPYSYRRVCGWTERDNGVKTLQCKTLIPHGQMRCELHNAVKISLQESDAALSEFPLIFGHSKIVYVKLPRPLKEAQDIKISKGSRTESSQNFNVVWERQIAAIRESHIQLEENWLFYKPSEITDEKIRLFNREFKNTVGGNWYFELFSLMERVKLEFDHPSLGVVNQPAEWALIEKYLDRVKRINDSQAQFQGIEGKYN